MGSKGLKYKNIKLLNGKPMLAYSIEAAKDSGLFDTIHVSTDSQVYADIASSYGADEPFLRSKDTSTDLSSSWDVVREVLEKYKRIDQDFDVCFLLQPTSPLRSPEDILNAYNIFLNTYALSLTSVSEVEHPIQWCFKLDDDMSMREFSNSPFKNSRRQDLDTYYRENGSIYIVWTNKIVDSCFVFYNSKCYAYIMDSQRSIDIDSLQDFIIAESILKNQRRIENE